MIGFIIGTMFGACAGVLLAGLLRAAKDGDAECSGPGSKYGSVYPADFEDRPLQPLQYRPRPHEIVSEDGVVYTVGLSEFLTPLVISMRTGQRWGIEPQRLIDLVRAEGIDNPIANDNKPADAGNGVA